MSEQKISVVKAYSDTPFISEDVYSILPPILKEPLQYYADISPRARDMFFLASLVCVGAALKNPHTRWMSKISYPNLYLLIAAPPFSFKSSINDAKGYVYDTMMYYKQKWQSNIQDWQMKMLSAKENKEAFFEPRPFEHYLIVPAKTNKPTLIQQLNACPINLLVANESSSIFNAINSGGYGDYKDILLNAWNHEEINDQTKTGGHRVMIESPRLSIVTTTTPNQAFNLTGAGSDGLLSRFCIYVCVDDAEILNGFIDDEDDTPQNAYTASRKYAGEVLEKSFWNTFVFVNKTQGNNILSHINKQLKTWKIGNPDSDVYKGILGRCLMNFGRIYTILTIMEESSEKKKIYIKDHIFEAAKSILDTLLEHTYRMITVENSRTPDLQIPQPVLTEESLYSRFVSKLPSEFTRTEAANIGAELGMVIGSVDGYLNRLKTKGILSWDKETKIYKRN